MAICKPWAMTETAAPQLELEAENFRSQLQQVLLGRAVDWVTASHGREITDPQRAAFVSPLQLGAERLNNGNFIASRWHAREAEWRLYVCRDGDRFLFDAAMAENQPPKAQIQAAYRLVLARATDPAGLDHHLKALERGASVRTMLRELAAGDEVRRRGEILFLLRAPALFDGG